MSNDGPFRLASDVRRDSAEGSSPSGLAIYIPKSFLLEREPAFWRFVSNLATCISAPPRAVPSWAWKYSPMFRSSFLVRGDPSRGMLLSTLLHVIAVTALISAPLYNFGGLGRRARISQNLTLQHEVIYYSKNDLLPLISPPKPKTPVKPSLRPVPSRVPVKLAFHPAQTIVSKPQAPDNRRQTIIQPDVPRLEARAEIHVPNLIRWNAPPLPPPAVPTKILRSATPVTPVPPPVRAKRVMPSLPTPNLHRADASAIPVAPLAAVKSPKLLVPVNISPPTPPVAAAKVPVAEAVTDEFVPEIPAAPADGMNTMASLLPNLLAISVAPAPPSDEVLLPRGSRSGEFAASPEGSGDQSAGVPSLDDAIASTSTGNEEVRGDDGAAIHVPGLSITGGSDSPAATAMGGTDPGSDLRRLIAGLSRPTLEPGPVPGTAGESTLVSKFFGARQIYTVYLNMPNLTSAAGSWVLRFAELDDHGQPPGTDGKLSTPEAIRKVDPMYVASAARERVQGTVTLAAVVRKDGTLANIRVVKSLDPRLDSSAVAALTQWRFHPAEKDGVPIDLEVLVQIPFRISSL